MLALRQSQFLQHYGGATSCRIGARCPGLSIISVDSVEIASNNSIICTASGMSGDQIDWKWAGNGSWMVSPLS